MAATESHIRVTKVEDTSVVEFSARKILDELSINETGDQIKAVVESEPEIRLLVSFDNVEFFSSAALGMLITLDKLVKERKGRLKLSDISPQIYEVFKITRLDKLFEIHETTEKALAAF